MDNNNENKPNEVIPPVIKKEPAQLLLKADGEGNFEFAMGGAIGEISAMITEAVNQDPRMRLVFYLALSDHLREEAKKISSLLTAASKAKDDKGYVKN